MTNEAAERVRERLGVFYRDPIEAILFDAASRDLDAALAEERRIVVERIRAALPISGRWWLKDLYAILDRVSE